MRLALDREPGERERPPAVDAGVRERGTGRERRFIPATGRVGALPPAPDGSLEPDPALEAMLPDTFQGLAFLRQSLHLADVGGSTGDATPIEAIVAALGAEPTRVSIAFAADPTQTSQVQFVAYRIPGVSDARLTTAVADAGTQSGDTVKRVLLGGKQVVELVDPTAPDSVTCLYAKGGVLLGVVAPDDINAGKGLERLP